LRSFLAKHRLPSVVEFTQESAQKIFGNDQKLHLLMFLNKTNAEAQTLISALQDAAPKYLGKVRLFVKYLGKVRLFVMYLGKVRLFVEYLGKVHLCIYLASSSEMWVYLSSTWERWVLVLCK